MALNLNSKVVIVGGKYAEREAYQYGVYICQPNRTFQADVEYIAFCHLKRIKYIYRIVGEERNIALSQSKIIGATTYLKDYPGKGSNVNDVYKLELFNPPKKHLGKGPYVRKQRYTTLEKYLEASETSQL